MNPRRLLSLFGQLVAATGLPYLVFAAVSVVWDPEGSPAEKRHDTRPSVSVVLPTYDESEIVESKLRSICAWDYPMDRVEVVVVDSSDDETPELVESFFADRVTPDLTLIEETDAVGWRSR
ncbi:MAG: glycosyltransferases involved in cell wall biogenesis [halophilic archaeon J07HB67]|nr:MAG: glycosyltransferases involved in cell wall biogenesis [halophilic archaeon J07HB67]